MGGPDKDYPGPIGQKGSREPASAKQIYSTGMDFRTPLALRARITLSEPPHSVSIHDRSGAQQPTLSPPFPL